MAVYAVSLHGSFAGVQIVHQRYYESSGSSASYQAFADGFADVFDGPAVALMSVQHSFTHLLIRPVEVGSIGSIVVPDTWPLVGTGGADVLPTYATARLKLYAAGTQHPVRGMVQWAGVGENVQSAGIIDSVGLGLLTTLANVFTLTIAVSGTEDWTPVLWSDTYQRAAAITGRSVDNEMGTQRRRLRGAGS